MREHRHHLEETYHLHEHSCDLSIGHEHEEEHGKEIAESHSTERRRLLISVFLIGIVMIVEAAGGLFSNSLALISDAGHMLTHLLALLISYFALIFSIRPPTQRRTFGFYRLEILAAFLNGLILILVTGWIFFESYGRFLRPQPIATREMLLIALVGLLTNLLTAYILRGALRRSLNVRSAFLHMIGDTLSSVGVVAGAIVISLTDWWVVDPALSVLLSVAILYWAFRLIIDSVDILLEATPREIDPTDVAAAVKIFDEVKDVHDVHVWTLTSGMYALSAHIAVREMPVGETSHLLRRINFLLCQRFRIGHSAIQFETDSKKA
jgi:cobalt-zinc-cadmium efflux system protein